jgi:asparagine synthase (glutamine-hydrolysing)
MRMNEATKHRGPDDTRIWEGDGITLGHNRLAIIDLSDTALQPMRSTDGRYVIVFNGEIYNYRELKQELQTTYTFKTQSDTEVLLAAYVRWGEAMFSKLRGIFAFGIWDTKEKSLLLARDHMGVKPLYYSLTEGVLTFSSEIPALVTHTTAPLIDATRIGFYLAMEYVPGPRTLVEGISKLLPGHLLNFKEGACTTRSYLGPLPEKQPVSDEDIYNTMDQAVKRQLVSDRPVGAYLSGGFDSSIVVHHMAKYGAQTRTYSVDFEAVSGEEGDSEKFNVDARLARLTAAFYGTEHKTLTITLPDIRDTIETALASASEPVANATAVSQYLLSDFVQKDGVVVVLGGDGGDELFGGYTRHRIAMGAYLYQQLPKFLQRGGAFVSPRMGKLSTPFFTPLHRALMVKDEKKIAPFLVHPLSINKEVTEYFDTLYAHTGKEGLHSVDVFMNVDRRTWLADECFIRSDYASMAHGLELRVPFVDTDVVHMADQLSVWKKVLPHEGKRVIRHAYKKYLPPHVYREPKRGWLSPAAKWFRDPVINAFAKDVFSSGYYDGLDGLFDWKNVHELLDAHVEKRGYYLYPLWNILALQVWARKNGVMSKKM